MKGFIKTNNQKTQVSTSSVLGSALFGIPLVIGMLLTGCTTSEEAQKPTKPAPVTDNNQPFDNSSASQCGPFTADKAQVMCTMHYDPVCVKHKSADGQISYKTAGNACTACTTPTAISYTASECGAEDRTR
ncbi:hypothetical protein [Psychrobacter sp. FDAARGOS_221]|uniref:hypothetical protein n=1 Tax=Psychrobacter sp. FDAARGOS_221 TaxID=1975705 RepID=UPI000BB58B1D|nr:hypothetical protein [Psychrobacter sp. FDAARGOS_221]PNK61639.1 hypothetical protein A6J60_012705 [Psychrobacter sp. FDAARGOS_221]